MFHLSVSAMTLVTEYRENGRSPSRQWLRPFAIAAECVSHLFIYKNNEEHYFKTLAISLEKDFFPFLDTSMCDGCHDR